jgi:ABC-type amino acid transport substrate-binding protein
MKPIWRNIVIPLAIVAFVITACGPQPTPTPTVVPTPVNDDLARVRAAGVMMVGTSGDYPPFAFYTPQFQLDGLDIALMRELGRRIGVQVQFQDFAFDGVLDALRLGQVDSAAAAISVTDERRAIADFTNYYYVGSDGIIARSDAAIPTITSAQGLIGKKVGVQRGSVYETWIRDTLINTMQMPESNLFLYANADEAARDVRDRRIDVAMFDLVPAQQLIARDSTFKLVGQNLNAQRLGVATRKGSTLLGALDQALVAAQADGTLGRLVTQYLGTNQVQPIPTATPNPFPVIDPTPTGCIDGMAYVADLNLNDNNMKNPPLMAPGQPFTKGWRVRNSGTCTWTTAYRFDYAGGNSDLSRMGGQPQAMGRNILPGEVVDFQVPMVAPTVPGTYQGFWQMRNAQGRAFGTRVWVGITVANPNPPTQPPPVGDIVFTADRSQVAPGERVVFTWQVQNARAVYFYAMGENPTSRSVAFSGQAQVFPQTTTTYNLRVDRFNNTVEIRQIVITVTSGGGGSAPVIQRFTVTPEGQIQLGQCVSLSWQVAGQVNRVRLLRNNSVLWDNAPFSGNTQDCPQVLGANTYTLEAFGPTTSTRAQRSITVVSSGGGGGSAPSIPTFSVVPDSIPVGACVTVSWTTSNAVSVRVTRNNTARLDNGQLSGTVVDCLQATGFYGYRIEAFSSTGQSTIRERAVTVFSNRGTSP